MSGTDGQEKIIERIRKLLRLGRRSDHPAEAEAALAKAAEIAAEAGLAVEGIDADLQAARITHEAGGARRRSHARQRCHAVLKLHFGVKVLGQSEIGCMYIGPAVNIAIARHVEAYLLQQCAAGWRDEAGRRRILRQACGDGPKRAFEWGFFLGVNEALKRRPIRNDGAEIARAVERYMADRFKITRTPIAPPSARHDAAAFNGIYRGARTPVDRPVAGAEAPRALAAGGAA